MKMTIEAMKDIVKTLPVGYYTGREIPVTVSDTISSSRYNLTLDKIEVSYDQLNKAFINVPDDTDESVKEKLTRTMLYHEVSHAIATPRNLSVTDWLNIFEDERIETILKDYYMNIDFSQMIGLICKDFNLDLYSNMNCFFALVRLHHEFPDDVFPGGTYFRKEVERIISEFSLDKVNANCGRYGIADKYVYEVRLLYSSFCEYLRKLREEEEKKKEQPEKQDSSDDKEEDTSSESDSPSNSSDESEQSDETSDEGESEEEQGDNSSEEDADADKSESEETSEEGEETAKSSESSDEEKADESYSRKSELLDQIKNIMSVSVDASLETELSRIFGSAKKATSMRGSAVNAYSGVFDPRSTLRQDYKYFLQSNRQGSAKGFSKMHLNLFLDRSGSFYGSELAANQIIKALVKIQKTVPNFDFTLITIGMDERIETEYQFSASGGNRLTPMLQPIFNKVQKKDAVNFNVVLFDGDALSDNSFDYKEAKKRWKTFNTSNTLIISDYSNEKYITSQCKNARVVFTWDYIGKLKSLLLSNLELLVR